VLATFKARFTFFLRNDFVLIGVEVEFVDVSGWREFAWRRESKEEVKVKRGEANWSGHASGECTKAICKALLFL
jgi:hypothetical protein